MNFVIKYNRAFYSYCLEGFTEDFTKATIYTSKDSAKEARDIIARELEIVPEVLEIVPCPYER